MVGAQTCSHHDRANVHSVLLEALSPEAVRLAAQQILAGLRNIESEHPVVSGQELLLGCFKILSLSEPDLSARQRVAVHRIHHLARDAKLRRDILSTKVGCGSKHQHQRKQTS